MICHSGVDPDLLVFGKHFTTNVRVLPHMSRLNVSEPLTSDKRHFNHPPVRAVSTTGPVSTTHNIQNPLTPCTTRPPSTAPSQQVMTSFLPKPDSTSHSQHRPTNTFDSTTTQLSSTTPSSIIPTTDAQSSGPTQPSWELQSDTKSTNSETTTEVSRRPPLATQTSQTETTRAPSSVTNSPSQITTTSPTTTSTTVPAISASTPNFTGHSTTSSGPDSQPYPNDTKGHVSRNTSADHGPPPGGSLTSVWRLAANAALVVLGTCASVTLGCCCSVFAALSWRGRRRRKGRYRTDLTGKRASMKLIKYVIVRESS